jgi:hypothetical protein
MNNYCLADDDGQYSANPGDYWYNADDVRMPGTLVKLRHPYRTVTGLVVVGPRVLKDQPTMRDLRRLAAATR